MFDHLYQNKRVLLTGHTGFKGSWLAEWLLALGAEVTGFSLPPPTEPALFNQLGLARRLHHLTGDIRDLGTVRAALEAARPDFVFHLAAQSLVRAGYEQPVATYATNVLGTVHVLEAVRLAKNPCTVIAITTDKCYENREWLHSYREEDALGGYDPYSSSKGAAELVISAYRRSYFCPPTAVSAPSSGVRLASARAGNVIGGGDWAADRIVPDAIRALQRGEPVPVRNPGSTRPWQHVLEPLSGYLRLGAALATDARPAGSSPLASAFNFGPALTSNRTVAGLVGELLKHWPGRWEDRSQPGAVHEAGLLNLATDKAFHLLQWQPVWSFEHTLEQTAAWYHGCQANAAEARNLTTRQIAEYAADAKTRGLPWA
jgi:CDP-glucose 4,6-dehydratase